MLKKVLELLKSLIGVKSIVYSSENRRTFFVIVHKDSVNRQRFRKQCKEIERIIKEEDFVEVTGDPNVVASRVPQDAKILVCGAYGGGCVLIQLDALIKNGFDAKMYKKAIGWRP